MNVYKTLGDVQQKQPMLSSREIPTKSTIYIIGASGVHRARVDADLDKEGRLFWESESWCGYLTMRDGFWFAGCFINRNAIKKLRLWKEDIDDDTK